MAKKKAPAKKKAAPASDHEGHDHGPDEPCDLRTVAEELSSAVAEKLGVRAVDSPAVGAPGVTPAGGGIKSWIEIILVVLSALMESGIFDRFARSQGYRKAGK